MVLPNIRLLAALDLHGMAGSPVRRWLVLVEFVVATLLGLALGILILVKTGNAGGWVVGAWATAIGLNYLPLALHALSLLRPGALATALVDVDIPKQLRRYSVLQAWVLVPLVFPVLALLQLRTRTTA